MLDEFIAANDKINENGFPDKETVIENNEAFIGKVAPITSYEICLYQCQEKIIEIIKHTN